jgi:integrase
MTELPKWIRVFKDGRIGYWPSKVAGSGKRKVIRGGSKYDEALKRAWEIVDEVEIGAKLKVDLDATWTTLFLQWERHHVVALLEGTYRARLSAINRRLLIAIGHVRLIDTDQTTLSTVIDAAVASGNGLASFDTEIQTLTSIARWAERRKWLPKDPFGSHIDIVESVKQGKRLAAQRVAPTEAIHLRDVPTWDDVEILAGALKVVVFTKSDDKKLAMRYQAAVRVAAATGLRLCELLALTTSDVDLANGVVVVNKQLDRYVPWELDTPMRTCKPKYGVTREVRVWKKVSKDLAFLVKNANSDGVLVPRFGKGKLWADAWANLLKDARKAANWTWTPHYLRHHYGSYSTARREDGGLAQSYPAVQRWMGHAKLKTTMETYIHDVSARTGWVD